MNLAMALFYGSSLRGAAAMNHTDRKLTQSPKIPEQNGF